MRRIGHVKSVAVWLMLLGLLCGMLVPGAAMARVYRQSGTEGDPGDGLGYTGGGGVIVGDGAEASATVEKIPLDTPLVIVFVASVVDGKVVVRVEFISGESSE